MPTILGSGEHRYRVVENWPKLPEGWNLTDVAAVAVDSKDRIYAFNRGAHPMVVFDRDGNVLRTWGEGVFNRAHGLHIGQQVALDGAEALFGAVLQRQQDGRLEALPVAGGLDADLIEHRHACGLVAAGQPGAANGGAGNRQ